MTYDGLNEIKQDLSKVDWIITCRQFKLRLITLG